MAESLRFAEIQYESSEIISNSIQKAQNYKGNVACFCFNDKLLRC